MTGLIALAAADNTVYQAAAGTSAEFYNLVIAETAGATATVDLYLSADATSAAGERIERISLGANETKVFQPVGVKASQYLLAKPSTAAITLHGEYIYRDGSDV
jgi:hypothetical protein